MTFKPDPDVFFAETYKTSNFVKGDLSHVDLVTKPGFFNFEQMAEFGDSEHFFFVSHGYLLLTIVHRRTLTKCS